MSTSSYNPRGISAGEFLKWLKVFNIDTGGSAASGIVSPGTINELGVYAAAGDTISGLTTANNGALVTSASGVPSISSTLPSAVQANITELGTLLNLQVDNININGNTISNSAASTDLSISTQSGGLIKLDGQYIHQLGNYTSGFINVGVSSITPTTLTYLELGRPALTAISRFAAAYGSGVHHYVSGQTSGIMMSAMTGVKGALHQGLALYAATSSITGAAWSATQTSGAAMIMDAGEFQWVSGTGLSVGTTPALTQHMTLDASGNLGIGTTSPSSTLEVVGDAQVDNINIDGNTISSANTNGDMYIVPDGTGRIGFKTTSPQTNFYFLDSNASGNFVGVGSAGNGDPFGFKGYTGGTERWSITSASSGTDVLFTSSSVGGRNAGFQFYGGSSSSFLMGITNSGDVGIGTASPAAKLDVAGDIESSTWVKTGSYTVAGVPSASTAGAGSQIFVTDETGGAIPAFSDGANWRRMSDRAIVS